MKNLFLVFVLGIFLISFVCSATLTESKIGIEKTFSKSYSEKYGKILIENKTEKLKEMNLQNNTDLCFKNCKAQGTTQMFKAGALFDDIVYHSSKNSTDYQSRITEIYITEAKKRIVEVENSYQVCNLITATNGSKSNVCSKVNNGTKEIEESYLEYIPYKAGTMVESNNYSWEIRGEKGLYENIDWFPILNGIKGTEFAAWNSSYNVGLVAGYTLNETTGNPIDVLGVRNGTNNGATLGVGGKIGTAYSFDGVNDGLSFPTTLHPLGTNDFTMYFWVNYTSSSGWRAMFGNDINDDFSLVTAGLPEMLFYVGGSYIQVSSGMSVGNYYNIVVVRDFPNTKVYINGVVKINDSETLDGGLTERPLYLGKNAGGTYFQGSLDEFYMYSRAWSYEEVIGGYNNGDGITYKGDFDSNPTISINSPINYLNSSSSIIGFNITTKDDFRNNNLSVYFSNVRNHTISLSNNDTTSIFNLTLPDGVYNWTASTSDNSSQITNSSNRIFTIDTIIENLSIISPLNNSLSNNSGLDILIFRNDTHIGSVYYSNDSMSVNTTLASGENITSIIWSEGQHNISVWANDTPFGNLKQELLSFIMDYSDPVVNFIFSPNGTYTESTIPINLSLFDYSHLSVYYNITTQANTGIEVVSRREILNWTNSTTIPPLSNGYYLAFFEIKDFFNRTINSNSSFIVNVTSSGETPASVGGGGGMIEEEKEEVVESRTCKPFETAWEEFIFETEGKNFLDRIIAGWRLILDLALCKSAASIFPIDIDSK